MKKGLLSILAGALVLVGCQNYDDQFDNLESQISALASTVAGLSQVQSDLASLAGTVSSLASTVNGLGDTIDTAVADGLTDIQSDIEAIETAVADVASSEEVSALQEAVDASQEDLTSLLENAAIFQGDVIINSTATLDVYEKMGTGINIVNGAVKITVTSDMDITKLQSVVDNILTTVEDFTYTSPSSDIAEVTFTNLTGTQSLTVTQAGGYDFRNLASATNITLGSTFKSSVRVIHFGSLLNATSFKTGSTANSIVFNKATELHLTKLKRYTTSASAPLVLEVDEGSVIDLTALDDVGIDGEQEDIFLEITGPSTFTASKFSDGALTFTDVATVEVNDFSGTITTNAGVESFTANKLVDAYTVGADIEILDVTGALDPDVATDQNGPSISSTSGNLESATIGGNVASISLSGANLETVVITADVGGSISISDSDDLTTVTLTGSKAQGVTIDDCDELASLTVDTTIQKGRSTTAAKTAKLTLDGSVVVTDNTDLSSLTISSSDLAVLTVTGNTDLEKIDGTGIIAIGATAKSNVVTINGNNLTATKSTDKTNSAATKTADGEANDLGSWTTTSGFETLKDYLTLVAANTAATAEVYFDTVESVISEAGVETATDQTYAANPANTKILQLTAKDVTTAGKDGVKHKVAYGIKSAALGAGKFGIFADDHTGSKAINTHALLTDANGDPTTSITLSALEGLAISEITKQANLTRATAYDYTLNAYAGYNPTGKITIQDAVDSTTADYSLDWVDGDANAASASSIDVLKLTINGKSVTTTLGTTTKANFSTQVANRLGAAWDNAYGTGGTSATESLFDVDTSVAKIITITVKDAGSGRRGFDKSYSVSLIRKETNTATPIFGAYYGTTVDPSDNKTISGGIVVTLESNKPGTILDVVKGASYTWDTGAAFMKLTSTLQVNADPQVATSTVNDIFEDEARGDLALGKGGDAVLPEGDVDEVATAAVIFSRVSWLAD